MGARDDEWVVQDADDLDMDALVATSFEGSAAPPDHADSASDSDYSDVATPVELEQRVPKGAELRLVAKVQQLGGFTTIKMPKEPGTVRLQPVSENAPCQRIGSE